MKGQEMIGHGHELTSTDCELVLREYCSAIIHMRSQKSTDRFGLVFGAGATHDLGFPKWGTLIERIADHDKVDGRSILNNSRANAPRSQLLYERYKARSLKLASPKDFAYRKTDVTVQAGWRKIVHDCLYEGIEEDFTILREKDVYLGAFLNIIKTTPLTVNYNFDDTLQKMLLAARTDDERGVSRGYATVWNANIQLRFRKGVIYHPNGFLPRNLAERPSEQLVFLEDAFADQLIESMSGNYAALATHFAQTTCLFVGLSLDDPTLKHLLRQNARSYPGHYHYFVHYTRDTEPLDPEYKAAVAAAYFDIYNLVTLFLTSKQIACLGHLLSAPDDHFSPLVEECGQKNPRRFFLTGPVSVGKSTTASFFRSLITHDEWTEPRVPGMEVDPTDLDDARVKEIDEWVADQIGRKNIGLQRAETGVHIIDRGPLDAFAFTDRDKWKEKAALIRSRVSPGASKRQLSPGHVILLTGDPTIMEVRAIARHKKTQASKLKLQQQLLLRAYPTADQGVTVVDTRGKTASDVVKEVSRIIHVQPYVECDMDARLADLEKDGYDAAK